MDMSGVASPADIRGRCLGPDGRWPRYPSTDVVRLAGESSPGCQSDVLAGWIGERLDVPPLCGHEPAQASLRCHPTNAASSRTMVATRDRPIMPAFRSSGSRTAGR